MTTDSNIQKIKQLLKEAYHTWYALLEASFKQLYLELVVSMLERVSIQRIIGIEEYGIS